MSENKKEKPTYQAPKVMPLGELAKGEGQASCHTGGTASNCGIGANASNNCNTGQRAASRCGLGNTPGRCTLGFGATGTCGFGFGR
jgi:hypothetical protein